MGEKEKEAIIRREEVRRRKRRKRKIKKVLRGLVIGTYYTIICCMVVGGIFLGYRGLSAVCTLFKNGEDTISVAAGNEERAAKTEDENIETLPDDEENAIDNNVPMTGYIVCIDPGHGGNDPGSADYAGNDESTEVLELSLLIRDELKKLGIEVVMTREKDNFVELSERARIANEAQADLFISIHRNFYEEDTSISGIEAWVNSAQPEEAVKAAEAILDALNEVGVSDDRGVKSGTQSSGGEDYTVNIKTNMPSMILEMGFMSNYRDNLLYKTNMNDYAKAIAQAVYEYLNIE